MDPFDQLLDLRQGSSSIVEYIIKFCEIAYKVPFDEAMLKDIFRFGVNEPIKSCLPAGKFNCSLKDFFDYALLCAGSSLTVGVSEEELAESAPEAAPRQELAESAPEAAPRQELAESAPEAAPRQELAESAPEAAPRQELAEAAPRQELAESAPSQELAEFALQPVQPSSPSSPLVPPSSPSSPLVPPSSPSSPLVPSSSAPPERPRDSARPEYPLTFAPPECLPEVVDFPFLGGSYPPVLTETPDPPWPMESPDPSWLPKVPDLPWPLKLPASDLETICALSASCVSVSSRSLSWVPAAPWWAPVSSAPPWWASVSSAPPWWAPDLPESPHVSADLPESPHVSADLPESPHVSADLPESPHVSADLPESPHVSADLPESPHVSSAPPWWAPVSLAPHGPGPPFPPPVPPPLHRPPGLCRVCVKRLEAALWGGGLCHESGSHSLKLHITHGLHFPSCTALTHSRPPLHQSHSCHHSLINSDCLTTPAPHSLTHIKAAHKHSPSAKSCFPLVTFLSVLLFILLSLCFTPDCLTLDL